MCGVGWQPRSPLTCVRPVSPTPFVEETPSFTEYFWLLCQISCPHACGFVPGSALRLALFSFLRGVLGVQSAAAIALLCLPFSRLTVAWCILVLLRCVRLINVVPMECPFPITERLLLVTFFVLTCVSPGVSVAPLDVRGLEQRCPPSPESFFALGAEAGLLTAADGWVLVPDRLRTLPCLWAGEAVRVHLG